MNYESLLLNRKLLLYFNHSLFFLMNHLVSFCIALARSYFFVDGKYRLRSEEIYDHNNQNMNLSVH